MKKNARNSSKAINSTTQGRPVALFLRYHTIMRVQRYNNRVNDLLVFTALLNVAETKQATDGTHTDIAELNARRQTGFQMKLISAAAVCSQCDPGINS